MLRLSAAAHRHLLSRLSSVPFNTCFAQAVLSGNVQGSVYVDRIEDPRTWVIVNRCGMSLLAGDPNDVEVRRWLADYVLNIGGHRESLELIQPHPHAWVDVISESIGERFVSAARLRTLPEAEQKQAQERTDLVVELTRLNFRFSEARFRCRKPHPLPDGYRVERVDGTHFSTWTGDVMPREFWDDEATYSRGSVAFGVIYEGALVSLAFAAFVSERSLEIGVETHPDHRGRGLALHAAGAFIEHALRCGLEPVWSCRKGNRASEATAAALGFELTVEVPYLRLCGGLMKAS